MAHPQPPHQDDGVVELYAFHRPRPWEAAPRHRYARESGALLPVVCETGRHALLVTSMNDVRTLLRDQRASSDPRQPGFPLAHPDHGHTTVESIIRQDPPEHDRVRRLLTPEFDGRAVAALRPAIDDVVHAAVDGLVRRGRPVDIVDRSRLPCPAACWCGCSPYPPSTGSGSPRSPRP